MAKAYNGGTFEAHPHYRWVKLFNGQRFYAKCGDGIDTEKITHLNLPRDQWTKDGSRQAANEWWKLKEAKLTANSVNTAFQRIAGKTIEELHRDLAKGQLAARIIALGTEIPKEAPPELVDEFIGIGEIESDERRLDLLNTIATDIPTGTSIKDSSVKFLEASKIGKCKKPIAPVSWQEIADAFQQGLLLAGFATAALEPVADQFADFVNGLPNGGDERVQQARVVALPGYPAQVVVHRIRITPQQIDGLHYPQLAKLTGDGGADVRDVFETGNILSASGLPIR